MPTLREIYDGDLALKSAAIRHLRGTVQAPHPLHGVDYADGVVLCGRASCRPCREYRRAKR